MLLKNDGRLLPLDAAKMRSLAVIGPGAAVARTGGGGSSLVRPTYAVTPLDGHQGGGRRARRRCATRSASRWKARTRAWTRDGARTEAVALAARSDAAVVVVGLLLRSSNPRASTARPWTCRPARTS